MENNIENDVFRCPKCLQIPSIKFKYENNNHLIKYKCNNKHSNSIPINNFFENFTEKNIKKLCNLCLKEFKEISPLYYCFKCRKYICFECLHLHKKECNNIKEKTINIKRIDQYCLRHGYYFEYYSLKEKKSICKFCEEYKNHQGQIKSLKDMYFNNSIIQKLEKKISEAENELNLLNNTFKELIDEFQKRFNQFYETNKKCLQLSNLIIKTYKNYKLNGEIIKNLKQIKNIKLFCPDFIPNTFNERINLFTSLSSIKNKNNFYLKYEKEPKIIVKEKSQIETSFSSGKVIKKIIELKDEKIAIIYDNQIKIYDYNTFKNLITININSNLLIQLKNSKLVLYDNLDNLSIYDIRNNNLKLIQIIQKLGSVNLLLPLNNAQFISSVSNGKIIFFSKNFINYQIESIYFSDKNVNRIIQLNDNILIFLKIHYAPYESYDFYYAYYYYDDYDDINFESYCLIQSFDLIQKKVIHTFEINDNFRRVNYDLIPFSNDLFVFHDISTIYLFKSEYLICLQKILVDYFKLFCKLKGNKFLWENSSLDYIIFSIENNEIKKIFKDKKSKIINFFSYKSMIQLKNGKFLIEDFSKNVKIVNLKISPNINLNN